MTSTDLDQQLLELQSAAYIYAARHQFIPDLAWPEGVRIAVNFTCDFDAMSLRRRLSHSSATWPIVFLVPSLTHRMNGSRT